ncbi:LOW QUALITY PROTEIN: hypothetical protein QYF61_018057 [Mycteria americana]|uniref:Core shell protein Gag P30 domain-containing protein n=1 Tax=Mycteria americana TaxID=33587 RepID=A0AAN7N3W3_MYCAM|nr:LOW QUALITY PROTEIN: hypothetical protein QYF61_018057 [Mycteria americana]
MGAAASQEAALCSPLGCILKHCNKLGGDAMTENQLKRYRNQRWPQYQWEDGEKWPENGSLKYNTISELMLCCRGTEKWDEMPSVDIRDWDIRKKGGLVDAKHRIGIYVLKEKKGKPRCIEWENSEEDIQLLVAPPKQPKSDSSSGEEKNFREGQRGTDRQGGWVGGVSWFSPSRQLSTTQPLAHSPSVGWGRESEEQKGSGVGSKHKCEGLERVKEYQKLILYGIQHGVQKPKNLSKLSEVRQGHKETPSAFSERLCEVARKRTDLDPEDDSNSKLFNTPFIGKVRNNREEIEEKEKRGRVTLQAALLAALREDQEKGRENTGGEFCGGCRNNSRNGYDIPLGMNRRANCKQEGRWKKDCPCRLSNGERETEEAVGVMPEIGLD